MLSGDVANEFLDDDGLADAGAAERANLTATRERCDQVDDLEACLKDLDVRLLLVERRRRPMDRHPRAGNFTEAVERLTEDVEEAAQRAFTRRNGDGTTRVYSLGSAPKAISGVHCQAAHPVVAEELLYLCDEFAACQLNFDRVVQRWQRVRWKLDVHDGADNLSYGSFSHEAPLRL